MFIFINRSTPTMVLVCWKANGKVHLKMEFAHGYGLEAQKSSNTTCATDPNPSNMANAGCSPLWLLQVITWTLSKDKDSRSSTLLFFISQFSALWVFHLVLWPISFPHAIQTTPYLSTSISMFSETRWRVAQMATIKMPCGTSTLGIFVLSASFDSENNFLFWWM